MRRQTLRRFVSVGSVLATLVFQPAVGQDPLIPASLDAFDAFGGAVAVSHPYLAIGAQFDDAGEHDAGAVYVYRRSSAGWSLDAKLFLPNALYEDYLGYSVAIDDEVVVTGAPNRATNAGTAFVFERNEDGWALAQELRPDDSDPYMSFGFTVAVSGDVIAVGAYSEDSVDKRAGAVYMYQKSGGRWVQEARLTASNGTDWDYFGSALALEGTTLLVAAEGKSRRAGMVYPFRYRSGAWRQDAPIRASDVRTGDEFGEGLALRGNTALIGAPHHDSAGQNAGAVFVYTHDGNGNWTQSAKLEPESTVLARYGDSIAFDGIRAVVGAPGHSQRTGKTYVYVREGLGWQPDASVDALGPDEGESHGESVAIGPGYLVSSADGDGARGVRAGAVYIYPLDDGPTAYFELTSANIEAVAYGDASWADVNADGQLDLFVSGRTETAFSSKLYLNQDGQFAVAPSVFLGLDLSRSAWADYDRDGDPDLLLTGYDGSSPVTQLYRNDGGGVFTPVTTSLAAMYKGSAAWGDLDNDGDPDLALAGFGASAPVAQVYRNEAGTFVPVSTPLAPSWKGTLSWCDLDNDGDQDLIQTGWTGSDRLGLVLRNDAGLLTATDAGLTAVHTSAVACTDVDVDGDVDLIIKGDVDGTGQSRLYTNNGSGQFDTQAAPFINLRAGSIQTGDFDNDGRPDVLITGFNDESDARVTRIYRNSEENGFVSVAQPLPPVSVGMAAWADFDRDRDLDAFVTGISGSSIQASLYRNSSNISPNTPPSVPDGLGIKSATATPDDRWNVTLEWDASADAETPAIGLSYNVRVGSTSGGSDIVSPLVVDQGPGKQETFNVVPVLGIAGASRQLPLTGLTEGTYYWSVQAIDAGFAASPYSIEQSFTVGGSLPVEFTDVRVSAQGRQAVLQWDVALELNNAGFEVEHFEPGTVRPRTVGYVQGRGTTSEPGTYEFSIDGLVPGTHTFRLRQIDFDGTYAYSPLVLADVALPTALAYLDTPYPNPAISTTTLRFGLGQEVLADVGIYDALGRRVQHVYTGTVQAGLGNEHLVNVQNLPAGQ
ncbi:MAG: FG-GAP-like repeat-containing protein, partial [Bacteroidota bacterium]